MADPDRYGVMGYPVAHSRSPVIHKLFALQTGQNMSYELFKVAPAELESAVQRFGRTGGKGLNITVPHKSEVVRLVDELSERASNAGAVNTLVFREDGIFGDNTDGVGLMRDLQRNLGLKLKDANILILGAGGAARGIIAPLLAAEPVAIVLANRTIERAEALIEELGAPDGISPLTFEALESESPFDFVINATSIGRRGEDPPFPESCVGPDSFCYDLAYSLKDTPFVVWARGLNAMEAVQGWGMLVEQAAESFYIWRGVMPDTAPVLKQLVVNPG